MVQPVKQEDQNQRKKPKQWPIKSQVPHIGELTRKEQKPDKPGTLPKQHIPIFDHNGHMRGRVGPKATSVTVSRFLGRHGAKLGKKDGKDAWIGQEPPKPPKPIIAPAPKPTPATAQKHKLEISLRAAKGSVSSKPSKPEAHARPHRG